MNWILQSKMSLFWVLSEYYEIDSIEMKVEFDFLLNSIFQSMHSFTLFCLYIIVPKVLISDVSCFISNYSRYHTDYQYLCQNWLLILCSFIILHSFIHSKFQSLYLAHYFKHWVSRLLQSQYWVCTAIMVVDHQAKPLSTLN